MLNDSLTNPTPQFGTAEYSGTSGADRCKSCNQSIGSQYYRVNGVLTLAYFLAVLVALGLVLWSMPGQGLGRP